MKRMCSLIVILVMVFSISSVAFGTETVETIDRTGAPVYYINLADIEASESDEVLLFEDITHVQIRVPFSKNNVVNTYVSISGIYTVKLGYVTVQTTAYVDQPQLARMRWIEGTHYIENSSETYRDNNTYYELSSLGTSSITASNTFWRNLRVGEVYWIDSIGEWISTVSSGSFVRSATFVVN